MNKISIFLILILLISIIALAFYTISLNEKIEKLEKKTEKLKLEYEESLEEYRGFLESLYSKDGKKIGSKELLMFLKLDNTEKIKYRKDFDCTGFALELYKKARDVGIKVGIVEVNFENEKGHMLNVFDVYDKGIVFIDVTGNEDGNGYDKIAFLKENEKYKTIIIPEKEEFIICNFDCENLAIIEPERKKYNIFSEEFLNNIERCTKIYKECVDIYNKAVEEYNRGNKKYSYDEMKKWYRNLEDLEKEISVDKYLIFYEGNETIKNIEIYW